MKEALRSGIVAISGLPNSGKSTLFNTVLGKKLAIVSPRPETSRFQLRGILTKDQGQMVLVDIPGFLTPRTALQRMMVQQTWGALEEIDLLWYLIDAKKALAKRAFFTSSSSLFPDGLEKLLSQNQEKERLMIILTKVDLVKKPGLLPLMEEIFQWFKERSLSSPHILPLCALDQNDVGIVTLLEETWQRLPMHPLLFEKNVLTDRGTVFFASEFVREQIFLLLNEEVPYGTTVVIEMIEEKKKRDGSDKFKIWAKICVLKDSQKAILIGNRGAMLKQIGVRARKNLEQLFERPCDLFLHVVARPNWDEKTMYLGDPEFSSSIT